MPRSNNTFEKLKLLYQSAIALKSYEGTLIWSRFSAFMVVNTIIFGSIGLFLKNDRSIYILVASIIGAILTILWLISTKRGFEAIEYWSHSIREIEGVLLERETIPSLYVRGEKYFKQNREVEFIGDSKALQRGCLTRCLSFLNTRMTAYASILLILFIYFVVIVLFVYQKLPAI